MDTFDNLIDIQHPIWQGLILAILLGMTLYFFWSPLKQVIAHLRIQKLVQRLGHGSLQNVYLPDGMDGAVYIEYLVLQHDGLLLLSIKPYRGNIFAAEKIDFWTQVIAHHSYKFPNPLFQLETDLQCLRGVWPKTSFSGMVVFTGDCRFPKGKPDGVYDYHQMQDMIKNSEQARPSDILQNTWQQLVSKAEDATQMKQSVISSRRDKKYIVYGLVSLLMATGYFAWVMEWIRVTN